MIKFIKKYFNSGTRSGRVKTNIVATFLIKGVSIITGFLMVPVCLDYLDKTRYGIWLTVSSALVWFNFFEIGLGSGLRNRLAESLAVNDIEQAKKHVSTTYAILSFFAVILLGLFFILRSFINWSSVFNTESGMNSELTFLVTIVFSVFIIRLVLKLITIVLYADQRPALANSLAPLGSVISLTVIYILTKTTEGSLIYLGIVLSVSPVLVMTIVTLFFFSGRYRNIAPSFSHIDMKNAGSLFSLGIKFFIIQISALILYHSSNIIIAQFFGPSEVTPYTISYKLFSLINMVFSIALTPFWSAFTEAWKLHDTQWIRRSIRKLLKLWFGLAVLGVLIFIFSDGIFDIWVGSRIEINYTLSFFLLIYFLTFTFGGIFNMFINGVGKIRLQLIYACSSALLFYPLTFLLIKKAGMGIEAVALAMIITNLFGPLIAPLQYYKIINGKAKGIWYA